MKRCLSLILVTLIFASCGTPNPGASANGGSTATFSGNCNPDASPFGTGDGSAGSPYGICSTAQLQNMGSPTYQSFNFILLTNLDFGSTTFTPLPGFAGTFNGNGYTIANIISDDAFIVDNTGILKNVMIQNATVTGNTRIGILVDTNENTGQITHSSTSGVMNGLYDSVGGLVGYNYGQISQSFSNAPVVGQDAVGGLVGTNHGSITNCYAAGLIKASTDSGGLVGSNYGTVTNSFSYGAVPTSGSDIGGLIGINQSSGVATGSYWDISTSGTSTSQGGTGETTSQMHSTSTFIGWNFTSIWQTPGSAYPTLR